MMRDSQEFPDDVLVEPDLDEEAPAQIPTELPLEAAAADWQEQLETVDVDPDEFDQRD